MNFSSDEVNLLIYRYLQESGFQHSAYTFATESNILRSNIDFSQVPSGALIHILQKGFQYVGAEIEIDNEGNNVEHLIDELTLIEAGRPDFLESIKKKKESQKVTTTEVCNRTDEGVLDDFNRNKTIKKKDEGVINEFDNEDYNMEHQIDELTLTEGPRPDILENIKTEKESDKQNARKVCNKVDKGVIEELQRCGALMPNNGQIEMFPCGILKLSKPDTVVCAWNPVANFLAGGSNDGLVRIWDIDNNALKPNDVIFKPPVKMPHVEALPSKIDITCLDWSFDGNYLAAGSYDGVARVWTTDGRVTCNFDQRCPIFAIKWNERGNYILTAGADGSTNILNPAAPNHCMQKFHFHSGAVLDVAWGTNTTFASCSVDKYINVCQLNKEQPLKRFQGHTRDINGIAWDPRGKLLASCSDDTTLKIWSMKKHTCVHNFQGHSKEVYEVRWSPTGPGSRNPNKNLILASGGLDNTIRLWDAESSSCVRTLTQHDEAICVVEFSPDGKFLLTGSFDKFVYIWCLESGELIRSFKTNGGVFDAAWNSTGDKVVVSSFDAFVYILDLRK